MQKIGDIAGSQANAQGEFVEPDSHQPGTIIKATWLNTMQREYVATLKDFGGTLDPNNDGQIAAILHQATPFDAPSYVKGITPNPNPLYYPEILTANHMLHIFDNRNGTCGVGTDQWFIWRNVWKFNTSDYTPAERTLPIKPKQTYHVRWTQTAGFSIHALSDSQYNPQGLAETHSSFDTSYDDMLLARVRTDSNNQADITPLVNQQQLSISAETSFFWPTRNTDEEKRYFEFEPQASLTINWARTPYPFINKIDGYNISRRMAIKVDPPDMPTSNLQYFGTAATRYELSIYDYLQYGNDETRWTVQAII